MPSAPPSRNPIAPWEWAALAGCLLLAAAFLALRIRAGGLPSGDEGSWLSAAAELAQGKGFTTRWLEYHWQTPYAVPRPDDMRYPVLVTVLAFGIKVFGPSFVIARGIIAALYLAFIAAAWFAARLRFGAACAALTALVMAVSPLQLEWASAVYCEGLFGLILSLWLIVLQILPHERLRHWIASGFLIALLTMVRPNGILLAAGLALGAVQGLRPPRIAWGKAALGLGVLLFMLSPWLIRNALDFGKPFHVGGSAGLLRESHDDIATRTVFQFFAEYGPAYPVIRIFRGVPPFLEGLNHYERGLHVLPLLLVGWALFTRRAFYAPAAAWGFAVSGAACLYAGYNSWAGIRYYAPFLPLLYAYGIHAGLDLLSRLAGVSSRLRPSLAGGISRVTPFLPWTLAIALILPVVNSHRFFHRHFSALQGRAFAPVRDYLARLDAAAPAAHPYLALRLCQVNYAGRGLCVGLQGPDRQEWLPRALGTFQPGLLALTPEERDGGYGDSLITEMAGLGWKAEEAGRDGVGVLLRLEAPAVPSSGDAAPADTGRPEAP